MNLLSTTVITRDWNWDYQGFASKGSIFKDDLYFILENIKRLEVIQ